MYNVVFTEEELIIVRAALEMYSDFSRRVSVVKQSLFDAGNVGVNEDEVRVATLIEMVHGLLFV